MPIGTKRLHVADLIAIISLGVILYPKCNPYISPDGGIKSMNEREGLLIEYL
jgi:hypothetical protein